MLAPEKWWYLSELAKKLDTSPSSLQRETEALVKAGILEQKRDGRRTYFRPEKRSPIYPDLRSLFEKTAGIVPMTSSALRPFGNRIVVAFVYGSMARSEEHAVSDIDLLIVGTVSLAALTPTLRKIEQAMGREVNVSLYSVLEFRAKLMKRDHFLSAVIHGEKKFVKGDEHDLEKLSSQP